MKLSNLKQHLATTTAVSILQPDGIAIPSHFHITEIGLVNKNFIDCGGTIRSEKQITFQLWLANDTDHQLQPQKLLGIINQFENQFGNEDLEIEVEYQSTTIGKYGLELHGNHLILVNRFTDCLAKDNCGKAEDSSIMETQNSQACCSSNSVCC